MGHSEKEALALGAAEAAAASSLLLRNARARPSTVAPTLESATSTDSSDPENSGAAATYSSALLSRARRERDDPLRLYPLCSNTGAKELISWSFFLGLYTCVSIQLPGLWWLFWARASAPRRVLLAAGSPRLAWLWAVWVALYWAQRRAVRRFGPKSMYPAFRHCEWMFSAAVLMTLSVNTASFFHTPSQRLTDVGFLLVPEHLGVSSSQSVSDVLTTALPFCMLAFCMIAYDRKRRSRVLLDWIRLMICVMLFRAMTVCLTSLPGPAAHCQDGAVGSPAPGPPDGDVPEYFQPATWRDVATHLGPLAGDYRTCGDLLFSGHAGFSTVTVLLFVKQMRRWPTVHSAARALGVAYLFAMCFFAIAARKHYTIDMVLGVLVGSLAFYRFENGWSGASRLSLDLMQFLDKLEADNEATALLATRRKASDGDEVALTALGLV